MVTFGERGERHSALFAVLASVYEPPFCRAVVGLLASAAPATAQRPHGEPPAFAVGRPCWRP
eukprot:820116-Lingulodinium_polyedra.AAC.1